MPKLSVWFIRASLLHMGMGFLLGSLILHHKSIPIYSWTWKLLNPHIEMMIFGWTVQLVMGVAFFALPRFTNRESRYGAEYLGWGAFSLLNLGVLMASVAHWYNAEYLIIYSRLGIFAGILLYTMMLWPRVKPFGKE